jgi:hypothetical protein
MNIRSLVIAAALTVAGTAVAGPTFDRNSWTNGGVKWTGDFWTEGNLGTSQYMTCVSVDGSIGSPEYWAAGNGDEAARAAYQQTLDDINSQNSTRNIMYIEVTCGF